MRAGAKVLGPLVFDSVETCAHNVVEAVRRDDWTTPGYWGKPGHFDQHTAITLDPSDTERLMDTSHTLASA